MAVILITISKGFIGLSTDIKPISVPVGAIFFERNTKNFYINYDGTNWTRLK